MNRMVALLFFILLLPIGFICSIFIVVFDGLPVFFIQKRIGIDSRPFMMYKFRTMRKNTPDVPTHLFNDSNNYIIKQIHWIRLLSLDELPNLINIIKGEMNFVGPRPALHNQEDLIELRKTNKVDQIKPGITGWAQINGRDEIAIDKKVELDLYYLNNRSIALDAKIILRTFTKILKSDDVKH